MRPMSSVTWKRLCAALCAHRQEALMSEVTSTVGLLTVSSNGPRRRGIPSWLRWGTWLPTLVTFVIAAVLWQLVAITNPYVIPTLEAIGGSLVIDADMYWA